MDEINDNTQLLDIAADLLPLVKYLWVKGVICIQPYAGSSVQLTQGLFKSFWPEVEAVEDRYTAEYNGVTYFAVAS